MHSSRGAAQTPTLCVSVFLFFHRKPFSLITKSISNAIVMYTISKPLTMGVMNEHQANFLTYDLHRASQNFFLMLKFNFHIHSVHYTTKSVCHDYVFQ